MRGRKATQAAWRSGALRHAAAVARDNGHAHEVARSQRGDCRGGGFSATEVVGEGTAKGSI